MEATRRLRAVFPDDFEQYRTTFREQKDPHPTKRAERLLRERRFYSYRLLYAEEAKKRGLAPRGAAMAYFFNEVESRDHPSSEVQVDQQAGGDPLLH